jgi:AraC family transcriptional regulator
MATDPSVEHLLSYIAANLHEPLHYGRLEPALHLDRFTIIRRVREHTGLTPRALQHRCRIEDAKRRILHGEPFVEIAHVTGFADQAHFCRVFKRLVGMSPGCFRSHAVCEELA